MIVNGKPTNHSGQGRFWGNLLMTAVCFLLFLGCLYAMGWWSLESVWIPGGIAMVLAVLTYLIPQQLLGRSDSVDHEAIHVEATGSHRAGH
ncbi:hypothetical protein ABDK96_11755 [Citricoccus nitrophenolicus]|uniref:Uncharacterized protein n=1 Tax=Citricoccus nitrophenolicus TaxID=863575 RepID=A0ABV0IJM1_9MICC|nr:hypothetical protein [Citricoccus sp. I39-566]NUL48825.1 hypothetical protein [Cellulosimicrobium funkei]WMY79690.1 hypothetical protein RE421_07550 [Citricoccus sp. I39-566]